MRLFARPRRLAPVFVLSIAVVATAAAVAVAGLQPADFSYTPKLRGADHEHRCCSSLGQELLRRPDCDRRSDRNVGDRIEHSDSNYAAEASSVAKEGEKWLEARAKVKNRAIVLDVDDTTLTTWNYELFSNWDFNPTTNAGFVGLTGTTFTGNMFPATPGMVDMVNAAKDIGYAVFFVTGRGDSQHPATIANLVNDTAAGFSDITQVTNPGNHGSGDRRRIRSPTPSTPATAASLTACSPSRHRPYPAYLNKPEFCESSNRREQILRNDPVQVRHPRLHRIAGIRHRRQLRRPVQRSRRWLCRQDVQDAEPELLPPVSSKQVGGRRG